MAEPERTPETRPAHDAGVDAWIEDVPFGLVVATPDGRIVRSNRTFQGWVGRPAWDLAGTPWFDLLTRAGRVLVETHLYPTLAALGRADQFALDLLDRRGNRLPMRIQVQVTPAGPDGPELHRITCIEAIDRQHYESQLLLAKRKAEDTAEELRELNLDLERLVWDRTAKLAAANQELDAFVHSVTHDLRGPLQVVISLVSVLEGTCGPRLEARDRKLLARISQAGGAMAELITAMLQMARDSGAPLERRSMDLSAIAQEIRAELETAEPDRSVLWEIQPDLATCGDVGLIKAVLRNLLGNAWKYSSHAVAPKIRFFAAVRDGTTEFCIADNGAGFDMAQAGRLFQPFQRMHQAQEFPGLGIGLATVKRIIDRHSGHLSASARIGEGAEFRFSLQPCPGCTERQPERCGWMSRRSSAG
jgi:signal transduction histidine kinase